MSWLTTSMHTIWDVLKSAGRSIGNSIALIFILDGGYVTKPARLAMLDRFFKFKWTGWTSQPTSWNVPAWAMNEPTHPLVHGRLKKIKLYQQDGALRTCCF